jgi:hypothetical protein
MTEDETHKAIHEQHRRLVELGQSAVGPELARAEEIRRDALRLIGGPGSLSSLFNQKGTFADLITRTKPLGAFYDVAGVSRLISESVFASRFTPSPVFDTSTWFKNTVSPLFLGDMQKQLAGLNIGRSVIAEQMKVFSGALGSLDYMNHFAELLREPLRQMHELFEGYEEDEKRLLEAIVPLGWLISPSMAIRTIRLLAAEIDNRTVEEIDDALVGYFDSDQCSEIVKGLYSDPVFEGFKPLIDEGLSVHHAGNYRAAILVWLAVIDGVAEEKFGVVRVFGQAKKKNGGNLRLVLEQTSHGREALHDALVEILKRVSIKDPDPYVLKRDRVMHGREIDFGNERASIQLLLVLEVMHSCSPLSTEDAEEAQPALTS